MCAFSAERVVDRGIQAAEVHPRRGGADRVRLVELQRTARQTLGGALEEVGVPGLLGEMLQNLLAERAAGLAHHDFAAADVLHQRQRVEEARVLCRSFDPPGEAAAHRFDQVGARGFDFAERPGRRR